jgi:hypothetical protein
MATPRYFIEIKSKLLVEITEQEFITAERRAGFYPKYGESVSLPATGGFSGGPLIQYCVYNGELPAQEEAKLVKC